jgi:phytoene dehydrogenase-like protein
MTRRTDFRIAILGAGPAGLSAALALREKGYRNVTVFEKSGRVGGQSLSEEYRTPDGRTLVYDMGSMQPGGSRNLFRLLKANGLTIGRGVLAKKSRVIAVVNHTAEVCWRRNPGLSP